MRTPMFLRTLGCAVGVMAVVAVSGPVRAGSLAAFEGLHGTLDIAGGTAHIPVMKEAAKRIMTTYPDIRITVAGGGSGVGVQQVGEGLVQIGNTGRPLSAQEIAEYGLVSFPFAVDGVAVTVSRRNPIAGLTSRQVRDIYAGTIRNWRELGGRDGAIHLYTRDEASGTREVFWKEVLAKGTIARDANVVPSNGAMKTAVAQDEGAIGYVGIGYVDETIRALRLDGVEPSQENASRGIYAVTRKLYMNTRGEPTGLSRAFIDYVRGPDGAQISRASGYIPIPQ